MAHKLVINICVGGFELSEKAIKRYEELSGTTVPSWDDIPRHDPVLVQVIEELGQDANGDNACLEVREIPGNKYCIDKGCYGDEYLWYPEFKRWTVIEED